MISLFNPEPFAKAVPKTAIPISAADEPSDVNVTFTSFESVSFIIHL